MVSVVSVVGLLIVIGVHTAVAAVMTRLFRVRLATRWAPVLYTLVIVPVVLLVSTLVVSGVLGIGPELGNADTALFLMIGVPLGVGLSIDYLWMPSPEEIDLPDTTP